MSDVLRLIAGGLIALCLSYIGVLIKRRYAKRVEFFKSASDFIGVLTTELSMRKTPVPEIIQKFLQGRNGEFETALRAWQTSAKNGETRIAAFEKNVIPLLKTEEKKELFDFFDGMGKTMLDEQLAHAAYYAKRFEQAKTKCEEENKRLGGTCFKLCVLLGLAVLLILA